MKKGNLISALLILLVSLCLIGCASTSSSLDDQLTVVEELEEQLVAEYSLVGYYFEFDGIGRTINFRFLDVASDEEVASLANAFMSVLPGAVEYTVPEGGVISITASSLNAEQFNAFVESAKQIIYNGIYR